MGIGRHSEMDVNIQSQTLPLFQYFLMNEIKTDITLTAPILVDDEVISVSSGHGFTGAAGEHIVVRSGDLFIQMPVIGVSTDDITVEMPIDIPFPDTASVIRGNTNLNVNGSSTPVDFEYTSDKNGGIEPVVPVDLSYVVITMQHTAAADDSLFGGITALTKGFYFRKLNGDAVNLGNYRDNHKFKDFGAMVTYTAKAGGGNHSTDIVFDLKKIFTQEIRLDPGTVDKVLGNIRDNASTLLEFSVSIIGSFTSGE